MQELLKTLHRCLLDHSLPFQHSCFAEWELSDPERTVTLAISRLVVVLLNPDPLIPRESSGPSPLDHCLLGFALSVSLSLPLFPSCFLSSGLLPFFLLFFFFKFYFLLCFPFSYSLVFSVSALCLGTQSIYQCQVCGPLDRSPAPMEGYHVYTKERTKLLKAVTSRRKISSLSPNLQY